MGYMDGVRRVEPGRQEGAVGPGGTEGHKGSLEAPEPTLSHTSNAKEDVPLTTYYLTLPEDDPEHLLNARWMDLDHRPLTDAARALVEVLTEEVTAWRKASGLQKRKRSGKAEATFRETLAALCADLLANARDDVSRWGYRDQSDGSFTGTGISARQFRQVRDALQRLGYLEGVGGFSRPMSDGSKQEGLAQRLRATERLLRAFSADGIEPSNLREHFLQSLPCQPLQLKAASKRNRYGHKETGRTLKFAKTDHTRRLEADVRELNEFLNGFELRGGIHRGYRRIFNEGDQPDFNWNKGGRLYCSESDCYQYMRPDRRTQLTLNGEPVVEIDIRASYMTILYAKNGLSMPQDEDPYRLEGLPRPVVKAWITATLGLGDFHSRWPRDTVADVRKKGIELNEEYPIEGVQEAVLRRHPFLEDWPTCELEWADLMFIESKAVIGTMLRLMREYGIPCLSVHDSVIVPKSHYELAKNVLKTEYQRHAGIEPRLKVSSLQAS